jgi:hypothetical protein
LDFDLREAAVGVGWAMLVDLVGLRVKIGFSVRIG